MATNDNILAITDFLNDANPAFILQGIAGRVKENRLQLNLTQQALATRAGVSYGSLRRFEDTGEISLQGLVKLAIVLDAVDDLQQLFSQKRYQSIDALLAQKDGKTKKRGRKNE
jgi:transcriptional regulator with XRE-family HTH domain